MKKLIFLLIIISLCFDITANCQKYNYANKAIQVLTDSLNSPYILQDTSHTTYTFNTGLIMLTDSTITIDGTKLFILAKDTLKTDVYDCYHQTYGTTQGIISITYYPEMYPLQVIWRKDPFNVIGYWVR